MQNKDKEKSKAVEKQFKVMKIDNVNVFHSNESYTKDQFKLEHYDQLTSKIQKDILAIQNLKDEKRNNIKNPKKIFINDNININTKLRDEYEKFINLNSPIKKDFIEETRKNYINNQEESINKQINYQKTIINNKAINENNQQEESTDITIEKLQIEEIYEKTKENKKRPKKFSCKIPYDFKPNFSSSLEFPYEPDLFQIQSFYFLENRNSIFVSAHTSSGKTSILHYCIHLAQKNKTRVIYTAPIKALSNQKYNELKEYKPGIITGDVSINKESNVLIVTTEILRNLLYSRSAVLNNLEFVVFDEVHYVSDKERGVVWEECIIMMPSFVTIAMLSACINNDCEFAEWVGRIRDSQIYVIRTEKRAVPLEYFMCKDEEIMNINAQGKQEINKVDNKQSKKSVQKNIACNYKKNNIPFLAKYIISKNLYPSIFFCFSKRKCHEYARQIIKQYLNDIERKEVLTTIKKSLEVLSRVNRTLPQVEEVVKYLSNGIAIHHSGLLPILKELTEIIFSKGLTKILIATETVSIGVNFPAKSVVFLDFKKTSTDGLRLVYPQEFMQMSGRAGRRGKDKKGFVIINEQKNINKTDIFNLINGTSNISSRFKLSFSMILRMLRIKIKVEDLIKKSFGEDDAQKKAFNQKQKIDNLERELYNLYKENNNPVFYANNSKPKYNDFNNNTDIFDKTYVNGKNEYKMHKNHRKDDKDANKGKDNTVKEDKKHEQIYQTNVHKCKICNDIYGFTEC
ncbi:Antiviral helicase ski2, partial [Conglomerata obtusa]